MGWAGHIAHIGARRGLCKVLVVKTERPRRRLEVNINMDLNEVECGPWTGSMWLRIGTCDGQL